MLSGIKQRLENNDVGVLTVPLIRMKTYDSRPKMTDECRCGGQKSKTAVQCRECFRLLQLARGRDIDWKR